MKILTIALKDIQQSTRNVFMVLFMFGIPLLVTGMFYVMFGGKAQDKNAAPAPLTPASVVVANLDRGDPALAQFLATPGTTASPSLGALYLSILQDSRFAGLMQVAAVDSAEKAHSLVDQQQAGVAVIIPPDFSQRFATPAVQATIELYGDPTRQDEAMVRPIITQLADNISAGKIAALVALTASGGDSARDPALAAKVAQASAQAYMAGSVRFQDPAALLAVHTPVAAPAQENPLALMIGLIMGAMMIFYAFYTGVATAQTILYEDERGTLPRLFTTPTPQTSILLGKLLAVFLTVLVQVVVLLILGKLVFGIAWGALAPVAMTAAGIILMASAFGVFVNSMMKNTKQGGVVFGGVLTFTGMLGMLRIFTFGSPNSSLEFVSLLAPQGWGVRGLVQAMQGEPVSAAAVTLLVMLGWTIVFLAAGAWRFQKRYA
jgi:ABC-2 type transport system permease protein